MENYFLLPLLIPLSIVLFPRQTSSLPLPVSPPFAVCSQDRPAPTVAYSVAWPSRPDASRLLLLLPLSRDKARAKSPAKVVLPADPQAPSGCSTTTEASNPPASQWKPSSLVHNERCPHPPQLRRKPPCSPVRTRSQQSSHVRSGLPTRQWLRRSSGFGGELQPRCHRRRCLMSSSAHEAFRRRKIDRGRRFPNGGTQSRWRSQRPGTMAFLVVGKSWKKKPSEEGAVKTLSFGEHCRSG